MRWWEETAQSDQSTLANCLSSKTVSQKHRGGGGGEARAQRWGWGEARAWRWGRVWGEVGKEVGVEVGEARAYSREHATLCMVVMPVLICRKV